MNAATERGIYVTNAPIAGVNSVAEHTSALILALAKRIRESDKATRKGYWNFRNEHLSSDIEGKILGLVGLGKIGQLVAKKMHFGFGMKIIAYDPYLTEKFEYVDMCTLEDLYKSSDYVSLHLPSTEETNNSVDIRVFEKMKDSAYLINASRGSIINEKDLVTALRNKMISGAAIDVLKIEPPNIEDDIFDLDNLIITPHYAALSKEASARMGIHAAQGVDEVLSGNRPTWAVNKPKL